MQNNKILTVLTPTYNRAYTLHKLYLSLLIQGERLDWLIVDDGSTDNTEEIVNSFINDGLVSIKYIKKNNGGKHTAINYGMKFIGTPLTMIVDSDDELIPNSIKHIYNLYEKYMERDDIGVFSFLKCYSNGKVVVSAEEEKISNYIEYRIKENRPGDMAEVFRTEILSKYSFPTFDNEKFISEDIVWIEIAKKYKTVFTNIPIYCCEYLPDGLSANDKPMKFASPLGSMMRGKQLMFSKCGIRENIKGAIIYDCYKLDVKGNIPAILSLTIKEKLLTIALFPIGYIFNKIWKK